MEEQSEDLRENQPSEFRSSYNMGHRWAALSFIGLLIAGNIWLGYFIAGGIPPQWVQLLFFACIASALMAGLALFIMMVRGKMSE